MIALWLSLTLSWAAPDVVVLRSDDLQTYEAPIERIRNAVDGTLKVYDLAGDRDTALAATRRLRADPPRVIVGLGAKAAWIAHTELPEIPLIFALVVSPERYGLVGEGLAGVSHDVPPDMQLAQLTLVAPDVKRLGMILGESNDSMDSAQAIRAAERAGLELVVLRVSTERHVRKAWHELRSEVDALWLVPDPLVVTPENFRYLREQAAYAGVPIITDSEDLVRAGALMCVAPDREIVGDQVAEMANDLLAGTPIGDLTHQPAGAVRVLLNVETQEAVGLLIDEFTLDFIDEVVKESGGR